MARIQLSGRIRYNFDNLHFDNPLAYGPYLIMQFGDLSADCNLACPKHIQRVHEISYIVSGKAIFICNKKKHIVEKGMVFVTPKGSTHEILPYKNEPLRYYYLGIEIVDQSNCTERILEEFLRNCSKSCAIGDRAIEAAFRDIFYNVLNQDQFSSQLIIDAIRKLLIWTKRVFDGGITRVQIPVAYEEKHRILAEICTELEESVENKDALKQLPEKFGYSYSHLTGLFSKAMDMSLREYFLMRRMEHACSLLKAGIKVTDVAEKMGYSSVHAFSHAFSSRLGVSPSQYSNIQNKASE